VPTQTDDRRRRYLDDDAAERRRFLSADAAARRRFLSADAAARRAFLQADAEAHRLQRQLLLGTAAAIAARQWATVDVADIAGSWSRRVPATAAAVAGAQVAAARTAQPYVAASVVSPAAYELVPESFAGAADGRSLEQLLYQPAITALSAIKSGRTVDEALRLGAHQLDTIVRTEVADASRAAVGVALTSEPAVEGYIRLIVGPTCARCIILAGRIYKWSEGFERHPDCDCGMVPVADVNVADVPSPQDIYAALTPKERSRAGWSRAEQQAIADGADIAAVTNIHRGGLYVAGGRQYTYEAAGRRPRITPRQIYREARGDRAEAVRLLRLHDYIR